MLRSIYLLGHGANMGTQNPFPRTLHHIDIIVLYQMDSDYLKSPDCVRFGG